MGLQITIQRQPSFLLSTVDPTLDITGNSNLTTSEWKKEVDMEEGRKREPVICFWPFSSHLEDMNQAIMDQVSSWTL